MALKTTITGLGKNPTVQQKSKAFHLLSNIPEPAVKTGRTNLMGYHNLSYNRFSGKSDRVKPELAHFLPHIPFPGTSEYDNQSSSSLRRLLERRVVSEEIHPLSSSDLAAFRLHPGPVSEQHKNLIHGNLKATPDEGGGSHESRRKKRKLLTGGGDQSESREARKKRKKEKRKKKHREKPHSPE